MPKQSTQWEFRSIFHLSALGTGCGQSIVGIKNGVRHPSRLQELAKQLGLSTILMTHRDLSQSFQDLSTFEYPFVESESGSWLWSHIDREQLNIGQFPSTQRRFSKATPRLFSTGFFNAR